MGGFKAKFIFLLVVYFAGFATAVYCLAPVPENQGFEGGQKSFFGSALKSEEFAKSFNSALYKCIDFGKRAALRTGTFLKEKYEDRQLSTDR